MKLATLKTSSLDGELVVVSRDHRRFLRASPQVPTLQKALETWGPSSTFLEKLSQHLQNDMSAGEPLDWSQLHSPLPRAYQWADGSAFLHHVRLVRKARGAPVPESLVHVPLMYQGGSDDFLAPTAAIPFTEEKLGVDFEGEIAVILDRVPMGVSAEAALGYIRLVVLVNDVTLRGLIPDELAMGFGFFQSKPSSAFSPLALTLDELTPWWKEGRLHLPLKVDLNGKQFGCANGGEMHFHFGQLIAHAARTRDLGPGTIIGSGTVSNEDPKVGSSCLVEQRTIEQIETGAPRTPYLKRGDRVRISMATPQGQDLFGSIDQVVGG